MNTNWIFEHSEGNNVNFFRCDYDGALCDLRTPGVSKTLAGNQIIII